MTWRYDELGTGRMPVSSQDMKLRGVVVKMRFKRIEEQCSCRQKISILDCSILDFAPLAAIENYRGASRH